MRNILFPIGQKTPVFGGGGGGGGGGGDSGGGSSGGGMSVTASTKSSGGGGYTSLRDMFDGGGPGQSGDTFGGALGGISNAVGASPVGSGGGSDNDRSDPVPAAPAPVAPAPPPAAPAGTVAGFGQDYNDDGRLTISEILRDMTDAGGPGGSGGAYSGGPLAGISNVVTGQFDDVRDMVDGGGPGQSGPTFEGSLAGTAANVVGLPPLGAGSGVVSGAADQLEEFFPSTGYTSVRDLIDGGGPGQSGSEFGGALGGISNTIGLTPAAPGPGAGAVYEGPTPGGSAGYFQDPGQMTVDPGTGFITSDENVFRPAPAAPVPIPAPEPEPAPPFVAPPPPVAPAAPPVPARVEPPPVSMGFLPPQMSMVGMDTVMAPTGSGSVAFDNYFAPAPMPMPPYMPPAPMPISDQFGMPFALSPISSVRVPDVGQFFAPPPSAIPRPDPNVLPMRPENLPYAPANPMVPMPGPTLDPKGPGGTTGSVPGGGIGSLVAATPGIVPRMFG